MENILIFKDVERIDNETNFYENHVLSFINGFKAPLTAIGIEFSLDQIASLNSFAHKTLRRDGTNEVEKHLEDFIYDGLVTKAGNPSFGGVPISKEKLRELIQFPDETYNTLFTHIKENKLYNSFNQQYNFDKKYLNYTNGVAVLKETFEAMLETEYSYYTKNDSGVYYTSLLQGIAVKMNEYENSLRYDREKFGYQSQGGAVNGLKMNGRCEYVVDLDVIRKLESVNTPFIVVEEIEVE